MSFDNIVGQALTVQTSDPAHFNRSRIVVRFGAIEVAGPWRTDSEGVAQDHMSARDALHRLLDAALADGHAAGFDEALAKVRAGALAAEDAGDFIRGLIGEGK